MKIYSFIFPLGESEFRTKLSFSAVSEAQSWAAAQLLKDGSEWCLLKEVPSSDHVFNPVKDEHYAVRWASDMPHYDVIYII
tara:strand:+ start:358 stop:600 length:243 start_codon:yes stop_codon:yes gene_type:complete